MTTIVKAATAAQFLSFVPSMLGYHPARSLVLIPFDGARTLGAMRFDLPDASDERELDAIASTLIGTACRVADADAVAAIVYTDERFGEVGGMPHAGITAALARRADACGLRMSDALCVGADGWGSHFDPECPPNGRPLNEIECDDDLPRAVGDQTTGADLPDVGAAEAERVARSLASLSAAVDLLCGSDDAASAAAGRGAVSRDGDAGADLADPADAAAAASDSSREPRIDPLALAAACTLDDLPTLFEAVLEWDAEAIAPLDAAALIWCLSRPALRDIALVQWCGALADGDEALAAQLRWEAGEEYPAHLAMHMWGEGSRPDPERLLRALAVVRRVAAAAPPPSRPGPLATCAWLAWAVGRSTHAERYARLACDIEPEHGLAEIVRSFVHVGHLPDWAFQRQGAR